MRFIHSVEHTLLARLIAAVLYVFAWMDLNQNHQKSGACQIGYWSIGCVRMTELNCEKGDEFQNYTELKLPDTSNSTFNTSMSLQECVGNPDH